VSHELHCIRPRWRAASHASLHLEPHFAAHPARRFPGLFFLFLLELVNEEDVHLGLGRLVWPRGQQNVEARGVFGYTEPDGSPTGRTPELIRRVTMLLVLRELPLLGDVDAREDAQRRFRLTSERTRDQSYTLEALRLHGAFTGDPEIDNVLVAFMRPPDLGAA